MVGGDSLPLISQSPCLGARSRLAPTRVKFRATRPPQTINTQLSINANMDNLSKKFMKQGRLVMKDFQDLQIMPKVTVHDKDELISSRQRSMLLTHKQLYHMLTKKVESKQQKSFARKASKTKERSW